MMPPDFYRNRWQALPGVPDEGMVRQLCEEVALTFLDRYYFNDSFEDGYIRLLCDMATATDETTRTGASAALFGIIVEGFCDDFEELQTEAYNRLMCLILSHCRGMEGAEALDERITRFGLNSFDDLFHRSERLRKTSCNYRELPEKVAKVMILSRVTIGADVALTSVLVQRFVGLYPDAEIVIIGGGKVDDVVAGNPKVRVRQVGYIRRGGLLERLKSWFDVLEAIDGEREGLTDGRALLVDPDSRLSQLGVLPLVDDEDYLFFNTRGSHAYDPKHSVSEMANYWFNQVTAGRDFRYPAIWLEHSISEKARQFTAALQNSGCERLIFINFGVGGNTRKRVGGSFEIDVLLQLLKEPGTVILLDRGFGDEELERTGALMHAVAGQGHAVEAADFSTLPQAMSHGLIGVNAGIDEAAALIGVSDEFIGYDSACQHMAAALDVLAYTIFAGSNNTRFVRRWRPFGLGRSEIIHVDTLTHPPVFEPRTVVMRLMHARAKHQR